jgi:RHS repeat-associated protein
MARFKKGLLKALALTGLLTAAAAALPSDAESQFGTAPASPSPTGILGSIGGRVTDSSGQPIAGVIVWTRDRGQARWTETDADGKYVISAVAAGWFRVTFLRPAPYFNQPNPFPDLVYNPTPLAVELRPGENALSVNFQTVHPWGTKVPSVMLCGGVVCGSFVEVFDFDDPSTGTNPFCGTDACDGPEDFNRNVSDYRLVRRIIKKGFSSSPYTDQPEPFVYVFRFDFDEAGRVVRMDGPMDEANDVTEIDYFADNSANHGKPRRIRNFVTETRYLETIFDGFQGGFDRPLGITLPNGRHVTYSYDSFRRITGIVDFDGEHIDIAYGALGLDWVGLPGGKFLDVHYGAFDTVDAITMTGSQPPGEGRPTGDHLNTFFDGSYALERIESRDANGALSFKRQQQKEKSGWTVVKQLNAARPGLFREYAFDNRNQLAAVVDEAGVRQQFEHNPFSDRTKAVQPLSAGKAAATHFSHGARGNLVAVDGAAGQETEFVYDDLQRVVSMSDRTSGATRYCFDGAGNITFVIDGKGVWTRFRFDGAGRLIRKDLPHGGEVPEGIVEVRDTQYFFDGIRPDVEQDCAMQLPALDSSSFGALTGIADNSGCSAMEYDLRGFVAREVRYIDGMEELPWFGGVRAGAALTTEYSHGALGNLKTIRYPSGRLARYYYCGEAGAGLSFPECMPLQMVRVTATVARDPNDPPEQWVESDVVRDVKYHPFGGVKHLVYGNGVVRDVTTDLNGDVTGIFERTAACDQNPGDPGCKIVMNKTIVRDNRRLVSQTVETATKPGVWDFSYDQAERLVEASWTPADGGATASFMYGYDNAGNRVFDSRNSYTLEPGSDRMTAISGVVNSGVAYSGSGELLGYGENGFSYNTEGMLAEVAAGASRVAPLFSSRKQMVKRTLESGNADFFVPFGANNSVLSDLAAGSDYVFLPGEENPMPVARLGAEVHFFSRHVNDRLHTTTTSSADPEEACAGNPYGEDEPGAYCGLQKGQPTKIATDLFHNGYRAYSASVGAFTSPDPYRDAIAMLSTRTGNAFCEKCREYMTLAKYGYGAMNPVNRFDLSGLLAGGRGGSGGSGGAGGGRGCVECDLWEGSGGGFSFGAGVDRPAGGCSRVQWSCTTPGQQGKMCTVETCCGGAAGGAGVYAGPVFCFGTANPCSNGFSAGGGIGGSPGGKAGFGVGLDLTVNADPDFPHELNDGWSVCITTGFGAGSVSGALYICESTVQ